MEINKAMSICLKKGIKVYPKVIDRKYRVAIQSGNSEPVIGKKTFTVKTINDAITNTYIYLAKK